MPDWSALQQVNTASPDVPWCDPTCPLCGKPVEDSDPSAIFKDGVAHLDCIEDDL